MARMLPLSVALSMMLLLAAEAGAQTSQLPSDPEANSPSGVVYELPLDKGRKDAAPRKPAGKGGKRRPGGGGNSGDREPTSIRSENNFGSSSLVPGVADSGEDASAGDDDSSERKGGSGRGDDGGAGGGSGGDGSNGGGASPGSGGGPNTAFTPASASGGPSDSLILVLIALILAVGSVVGLLSGRAWRRRST